MGADEVGKIIHFCRKQSKLSQLQLATLAGVGKTVIYDVEKGKESIQLNTLLKILDALNIKLELITPFSVVTDEST